MCCCQCFQPFGLHGTDPGSNLSPELLFLSLPCLYVLVCNPVDHRVSDQVPYDRTFDHSNREIPSLMLSQLSHVHFLLILHRHSRGMASLYGLRCLRVEQQSGNSWTHHGAHRLWQCGWWRELHCYVGRLAHSFRCLCHLDRDYGAHISFYPPKQLFQEPERDEVGVLEVQECVGTIDNAY